MHIALCMHTRYFTRYKVDQCSNLQNNACIFFLNVIPLLSNTSYIIRIATTEICNCSLIMRLTLVCFEK